MANWPWADAESPGPPVLINCADLISSHQSLWKVLLRGPREQPLLSEERPPRLSAPPAQALRSICPSSEAWLP